MKKTILSCFVLFCISLHLCLAADVLKDNPKFYFCNSRIFVSDQSISVNDINEMCENILSDNRIYITIQKDLGMINSNMNLDNYFTRDTEEFFSRQCARINRSTCDYGFMISVYSSARKVRITAGSISKNMVTVDMRNNIILSIRNSLTREKYAEGIIKAIQQIQSYSYYNPYNNNPPKNNNPIYIAPSPPKPQNNSNSSLFVFIFLICPCLLCCVYFMYKRSNTYQHQDTAEDIHNHIAKLESLLRDINRNSPPILSINKCLICMDCIYMNQQMNHINHMNNLSTTNNDYHQYNNNLISQDLYHTRFACGHVYHNKCLNGNNLTSCMMCPGSSQAAFMIPNTHDGQVVDETRVKTFLQNLPLIYNKERLQDYARSYPSEFDNYNTTLALGLVGVWGITAVAASAYMMSDFNHSSGYNQINQQYESNNMQHSGYDGNQVAESDTAGGDF